MRAWVSLGELVFLHCLHFKSMPIYARHFLWSFVFMLLHNFVFIAIDFRNPKRFFLIFFLSPYLSSDVFSYLYYSKHPMTFRFSAKIVMVPLFFLIFMDFCFYSISLVFMTDIRCEQKKVLALAHLHSSYFCTRQSLDNGIEIRFSENTTENLHLLKRKIYDFRRCFCRFLTPPPKIGTKLCKT